MAMVDIDRARIHVRNQSFPPWDCLQWLGQHKLLPTDVSAKKVAVLQRSAFRHGVFTGYIFDMVIK
jgi:hypothetical protein